MSHPWFPLYARDYLATTSHLSAEESGTYIGLLMLSWVKGPLTEDSRRLAIAVRSRPAMVKAILQEFFTATGSGWVNNRLERERDAVEKRYLKRKAKKEWYKQYLQSDRWKEIRAEALARDDGKCRVCGGAATQAHHVRYPAKIEKDCVSNVVSLCRDCHKKEHALGDVG